MRQKCKERVLTRNVKVLEVQDLRVPLLDETGQTLDLVSKEEQLVSKKMAVSMGFWAVFATACYPVAKVLLLCLIGAFLANHRFDKFPAAARKHMNHMVFMVFTPALVFVNLGPAVTIRTLLQWWFMPFSVFINSAIGFGLGYIVVLLTKPPPHLVRVTIACCTIGNMGNLPLVLISAICSNSGSLFGAQCSTQGLAYSSYGMLMAVIVMWSFIYNFLEPPESNDKQHQLYEMLNVSPREPHGSHTLDIDSNPGTAAEKKSLAAGVETGAESVPAGLNRVEHGLGGGTGFEPGPGRRKLIPAALSGGDSLAVQSGGWREYWRLCTSWLSQQKWEKMVTPPVCGVLFAIVVGGTDPLQDMFFGKHAWFKLITDVLTSLAGAMIPCMMLVLGGNLAEGPSASEMKLPTMLGIGCVRLVILPILGVAVMIGADLLSILPPNDPLFRFVLLLQFAMPTAINLGTVTTMHGVGEKEVSSVLFWSYLVCTVTTPAFIMWYLYILV